MTSGDHRQIAHIVWLVGSSIIFLVVIAIWAVFLLPDLQIRRHQLAESRTATRMLGASRVLRRDNDFEVAPEHPAEGDRAHRPALRAGRAARPPVSTPTEAIDVSAVLGSHPNDHHIGARSHAVTASTTGSTSIAALDEEYVDDALAHPVEQVEPEPVEPPVAAREGVVNDAPESPVEQAAVEPDRDVSTHAVDEVVADGPEHRTPAAPGRGVTLALAGLLLAGLVAVPVTLVLSIMSVLPWVSVLVALILVAGAVLGLRTVAKQRRVARQARRAPARMAPARSETPVVREPKPTRFRQPAEPAPPVQAPSTAADFFDQDAAPAETTSKAAPAPVDVPSVAPKAAKPRVDDRPGQWMPRDVPRPTYLMKPRAPEGRLVAPNIGSVDTAHADPFGDLLDGDDDVDPPIAVTRAV